MTNKEIVEFFEALKLLAKEKGIEPEYLIERIRAAIVVAVKKDFGGEENIIVTMDPEEGHFSVVIRKEVVEEVTDPDRQKKVSPGKKPRIDKLVFHGLRHSYNQNREKWLEGDPRKRQKLSEGLGHHRLAVNDIYRE